MEVSVKGAHLTYPLTTMRSFCHDLVETYSHYVYPPWVDPYPQVNKKYTLPCPKYLVMCETLSTEFMQMCQRQASLMSFYAGRLLFTFIHASASNSFERADA